MMISRLEPEEPPTMATTRLGAIAMHLVIKFLFHLFILMSKKPYKTNQKTDLNSVNPSKKTFYSFFYDTSKLPA
jgi:hypothetical protein